MQPEDSLWPPSPSGVRYLNEQRRRRELAEGVDIDATIAAFRRWMFLPDPAPLLAVLGTVAANRLEGDPVWLMLVGPPGGGKSEVIGSVSGLENVHLAATLTEAALLSGTPQKDKAKDAKGGLLRVIGDYGIVVCKDFGSVLSMHRDARSQVLAALREVYDGSWTRHVGTDGGRTLHWDGKVGLVAGCTPTIDRHHAVMGSMGERFLLFRLPIVGSDQQAHRALAHAGREKEMRAELSSVVTALFQNAYREPRKLSAEEIDSLVSLTELVVRARSAVERDGYSREIELIPEPEAPTRLIVVLDRLLAGMDAIGIDRAVAWSVVGRAALDSIPALRRSVMDALLALEEDVETPKLAEELGYPTVTTRRALEDLTAHGIAHRVTRGAGRAADAWSLTEWARTRYAVCVPETSKGAGREAVLPFFQSSKGQIGNTNGSQEAS